MYLFFKAHKKYLSLRHCCHLEKQENMVSLSLFLFRASVSQTSKTSSSLVILKEKTSKKMKY